MSCLLHLLSTAFDTLPICLLKISTDNSIASISSAFGWFILFRRCFMISSSHSRDDLHHAAHEHCRAIHGHTPIWFALLSLFVELFHLLLVLSPKLSGAVVLESIDGSLLSLTLPIKNVAPCMLLLVACRPASGFISGRPSSSSSAVYVEAVE